MPRKTRYIPLDLAGSSGNEDPGSIGSRCSRPHGPQEGGNSGRNARGDGVDGLVEAFSGTTFGQTSGILHQKDFPKLWSSSDKENCEILTAPGSSIHGAHEGVIPRLGPSTPGGYAGGVSGHSLEPAFLRHAPPPPPSSTPSGGFLSAAAASFVPSLPRPPPYDYHRRKAIVSRPTTGKVYYLPDPRYIRESVIHLQNRKIGFFKHPVLVVGMENETQANFYSLTKEPPRAIKELKMCLRLGEHQTDTGRDVLELVPGSDVMNTTTWVNLEQRFSIEWYNLDAWLADVRVEVKEVDLKLWTRINELEAEQNRFLYKPLPRDMTAIVPGSIIMLLNDPVRSTTLGAPVLIIENLYPRFLYLRVKEINENIHFNPAAKKRNCNRRDMCLRISQVEGEGHDGTPLLVTTPDSPATREPSYVEILPRAKTGHFEVCKTWCFPPIVVTKDSLQVLKEYMVKMTQWGPANTPFPGTELYTSPYHPSDVRYRANAEAESSSIMQSAHTPAPPQQHPWTGYGTSYQPGAGLNIGNPYHMGVYERQWDDTYQHHGYGIGRRGASEEHDVTQEDEV